MPGTSRGDALPARAIGEPRRAARRCGPRRSGSSPIDVPRPSVAPRAASGADPWNETRRWTDSCRSARAGRPVASWTLRPDARTHQPGERPQRRRWGRRGSEERRETSGRKLLGASREAPNANAAPREEAICAREWPDRRAAWGPPVGSGAQLRGRRRSPRHPGSMRNTTTALRPRSGSPLRRLGRHAISQSCESVSSRNWFRY